MNLTTTVGRRAIAALLLLATLTACGQEPTSEPPPAYNSTDVMFLQMSLEYIRQGEQVLQSTAQQSRNADLKTLTAALGKQWTDEKGTMQRWLMGWEQPLTADPNAGVHEGHGDLHSLRPSDIAELQATKDNFDGTAQAMLLGHLHNCVEVSRMESAGGHYPPAMALAERMTSTRQGQVQQLLKLQTGSTMGA